MLGTYRLVLAVLVALSHIGVGVFRLNPGVIAVVGFYLVSGYVMTGLIRRYYNRSDRTLGFYRDRFLRLYPHYLVIAGITLAWLAATGAVTDYLRAPPTIGRLLENALVVPLNWFMFNQSDRFTLIPPAWSLGAEVQFYIVVPAILLTGIRLPLLLASVAVYASASFGIINSDWFGYRLLPGVLWIFLLGTCLYDLHQEPDWRRRGTVACVGVTALAAAFALLLAVTRHVTLPYNRETLIGLVAGVTAIQLLAHRPRRPLDDFIGNLSYGVFLCHFLVMWVFFGGQVSGWAQTLGYLSIAVAIALCMFLLVERPVLRLRHRLRRR